MVRTTAERTLIKARSYRSASHTAVVSTRQWGKSTLLTDQRQPRHFLQRSWQRHDTRDDHANNPKHNRAGRPLSYGIQSHREGQQMTRHQEHQEEQLTRAKQFTSKAPHQHLACIGHAGDMRMSPFELPDHEARVRGQYPKTEQDYKRGDEP